MSLGAAETFGIALMAAWGAAGAVALGRSVAKSPVMRELAAEFRKMNLAAKCAFVAGLVGAVAIGGTKPAGRDAPTAHPPGGHFVETSLPAPPFALVEVRTNGVAFRVESASAVEIEDWRKHGSSSGGVWLNFEEPVFRIGTNSVSRAHVAANGVISFDSMRRPPVGALLPDGTGLPVLAPLLAPLGMVPEANWTNVGASSRFWHDAVPGHGRVFTWEDALLDRMPGRRVAVQAELRPSGDFTYRYDFTDMFDPPATNLVIGAQVGTNGVNALANLGTNLLAETVWRVDGARETNGVSIADLLCTNGVLRTPTRFAIEWKNASGLSPNADTDGDGLSDWDEFFLQGTDPRRTDTDGDGLADGAEVSVGLPPSTYDADDDGLVDGIDPHPLVSDGDGFGTSDLWVQCSFTNAAEILAEGYENHVFRITGESPPDRAGHRVGHRSETSPYRRLYLLTATVGPLPTGERILVGVGEKRIVVDSAGRFVFPLQKGKEYELVTDAPDLVSFCCASSEAVVVSPTWASPGRVFWQASGVEVTPSSHHFSSPGSSCLFSAVCLDCHPDNATDWSWTSDCQDLAFDTPGATECTIRWTGVQIPWGSAVFTVSCSNLGQRISTDVQVTFGEHTVPQTALVLSAPPAFFVNDDDDDGDGIVDWDDSSVTDDDDLVSLSIVLVQDSPVGGTVSVSPVSSTTAMRVWTDRAKTTPLTFPVEWAVSASPMFESTVYLEGGTPSASLSGTGLRAEFVPETGESTAETTFSTTVVKASRIESPGAPTTGLAVLAGTSVPFRIALIPAGMETASIVAWKTARRKFDGGYRPWTNIMQSFSSTATTYGFPNPGIYRVSADVTVCGAATRTVHYLRTGRGPYDAPKIERWNHVGVAATQRQLALREFALGRLGSTQFAFKGTLLAYNGFSSIGPRKWKCNAFVAFCATSVGLSVPALHGQPPFSAYPPMANDWANGTPISGWTYLGTSVDPEPGWICGHPQQIGSGHVGIVDYDGYAIAAGTTEVNRKSSEFLDGRCGYSMPQE